MYIRNCTEAEIENALFDVNELYDGNIRFKRFDFDGVTRQGKPKWIVTLTVHSSYEPGSRRSPMSWRRIAAACWHVHGEFFDALPEGTEIITHTSNGRVKKMAGDAWEDYSVGSLYRPMMASQACEC